MAGRFDAFLDRVLQRRVQRRWGALAESAADLDLESLSTLRGRARAIRRQLDRVIHEADHRLALPVIGSNAMRRPLGNRLVVASHLVAWADPGARLFVGAGAGTGL